MNIKNNLLHKSIIHTLQDQIDLITEEKWNGDECMPIFKVNILYKENFEQQLILTINHLGSNFSRVLFPIKENFYGYESLYDVMKSLYNQTM